MILLVREKKKAERKKRTVKRTSSRSLVIRGHILAATRGWLPTEDIKDAGRNAETNERTNERTSERASERTNERASEQTKLRSEGQWLARARARLLQLAFRYFRGN